MRVHKFLDERLKLSTQYMHTILPDEPPFLFIYLFIYLFIFAFFMDRDEVEVHKNAKKKERDQYPTILTEQAWSIKDLLYGKKITPKNFTFAGTKRAIPSGLDRPIFPAWVANQNAGFHLPESAIYKIC